MKGKIVKFIIIILVIAGIVGFNMMMNSGNVAKHTDEEADGHDHGGPKILDATLAMGKVCCINTEKGTFDIVLLSKDIRNSTSMFYRLAKGHKYDNVKFAEVKDWIAKTDFATADITPLEQEQAYGIGSCRGAVGFAKGNKTHESVSSFFIIKETSPSVAEGFTIFGYVVKGMDVVDKLTEEDSIKSVSFRKADKEDETALVKLIKDSKEDSMAVQAASAKAEQAMMEKQMKNGPAPT
ncbi:MAG: peptidylprolyl isomerase, partial [Armatimonadetes bacterium]|nr:peptidylprolyl isomerase [Candidatus Hippobium faecium]